MSLIRKIVIGLASFVGILSLASAEPPQLHEAHSKLQMTCESCHLSADPAKNSRVESEKCIQCHGDLKKISETIKAKKLIDPDPHWNHMIDIQCWECHKEHKPGVNMCSRCHNLDFKVP